MVYIKWIQAFWISEILIPKTKKLGFLCLEENICNFCIFNEDNLFLVLAGIFSIKGAPKGISISQFGKFGFS